jgi:hypothetical protein
LKNSVLTVTSITLIVFATLTTVTAVIIKSHENSIDLVQKIKQLQKENRRDDALVLARTFKDSNTIQRVELAKLHDQLEYSTAEKFKSALWDGMMKGEMYDHYSGLGAVTSEMCLWSDIRDLAIKRYSFMNRHLGDTTALFPTPSMVSPAFCYPIINGPAILSKTTIKYLGRLPKPPNTGLVRQFVSGDSGPINEQKIWQLFKKTTGQSLRPPPSSPAFPIRNTSTQHLI